MSSTKTISVPESIPAVQEFIARMSQWPALTPFSTGVMIEMPCCGFRYDAEAVDCAPGPSRVYDPPRWTCDGCERIWEMSYDHLVEINHDGTNVLDKEGHHVRS